MTEFELIQHFFAKSVSSAQRASEVVLGIGDDAAVVEVPPGYQLVTSVDTLVEGVHFFPNEAAHAIGYRSLAVNLSDCFAMGACPKWLTLSLTCPEINKEWLADFSRGFFDCASQYNVQLIGGDTTRGPLSITVQVLGVCQKDAYITRSGARIGDSIYVVGALGGPDFALKILQSARPDVKKMSYFAESQLRFLYPILYPQFAQQLSQWASAAIDISDGLVQDLNHILVASGGLGATIVQSALPPLHELITLENMLYGGDEYLLCFTVPQKNRARCEEAATKTKTPITMIGIVDEEAGIRLAHPSGENEILPHKGWQHFS